MKSLTLVGSTTSPFVRKLRIYMHYNQIPFEFKSINYLGSKEDSEFLKKLNPINKIPFLLIGNEPLFESRVIYNYLNSEILKNGKGQVDSIADQNALSEIDGLLETFISLFQLKRGGMDIKTSDHYYVLRQHERIQLIAIEINKWIETEKAQTWNYQTMSLFSVLDWAHFREMLNLDDHPKLKHFYQKFLNSPFVEETKIIVPN